MAKQSSPLTLTIEIAPPVELAGAHIVSEKFIINSANLRKSVVSSRKYKIITMNKSKVYMTTEITPESLVKVYEALQTPAKGKVAVKISTGEPGGHNYLKPELIGKLVQLVGGTIVECNTIYGGGRGDTQTHMQTAADHGFTAIAPVDIMDADGEMAIPVRDTTYIKHDIVGDHLKNYDFMINLAHFKGHGMGGFGGVLKNQAIGVASPNGKCYQHSTGKADNMKDFYDLLWSTVPEGESAGLAAADWGGNHPQPRCLPRMHGQLCSCSRRLYG